MRVGIGRVKDSRESWMFLVITGCVLFYFGGIFDSYGILVVVFLEYFDETNTKIGWINSLTFSLQCFSFPLVVALSRRFGFRAVIFTSAVLATTGYLTTPLVPSVNYLFLSYSILLGVSFGFVDCISITVLREYFERYVGLATGIRFACTATGSMIFNFLIPIIIDDIGWQNMFYCFSSTGVALLFLAFCYRTKPASSNREIIIQDEPKVKDTSVLGHSRSKQPSFLRDRSFQLIVIGCIPFLFAMGIPLIFMAQYAKSIGYPLSQAKWLVVVRPLGSLVGRIIAGLIGDFASRRKVIPHIACTLVTIFGLASGLCSLTQHLPLMILYMTVVGILEGVFWVILPLLMYALTNGINSDYAFAVIIVITGTGYLAGPSSMGKVFDVTGDFRIVLYIVCVCCLVAGVIMAFGIYVSWQTLDRSELRPGEDDTTMCWSKMLKMKCYNINGRIQQDILSRSEKQAMMQYETTV
ncbi:monocarboxylate transporter 8-like [Dendronephthya gigantea]|uniref:monocarboxylate transporter 8-like n=1 Tax=Dendronephthya gigantea TaxID=151771 RepID=UPI00106AFC40|nr:monocarboxylate transporter 8-like [Dendronephthya gigantea]